MKTIKLPGQNAVAKRTAKGKGATLGVETYTFHEAVPEGSPPGAVGKQIGGEGIIVRRAGKWEPNLAPGVTGRDAELVRLLALAR